MLDGRQDLSGEEHAGEVPVAHRGAEEHRHREAVARSVLAHRVTVKPELWMTEASGSRVVEQVLTEVPTPAALEGHRRP